MKKQIFAYIRQHPGSTHHDCAAALKIGDIEAMNLILSLHKNGLLSVRVLTLDNAIGPDNSQFYIARGEYPKEEK